jgi:hypothetical protein
MESEQYLGYLDKEMTIMGILSAFCVAVPSLVLERLTSAPKESELVEIWSQGEYSFLVASILMLFSAALFYKQRSLLAFYYGRIALGKPLKGHPEPEFKDWKELADSWTTWIPYNAGVWTGVAAGFEYFSAFLAYKHPYFQKHASCCAFIVISALVVFLGGMLCVHMDRAVRLQDNPWIEGLNRLHKKKG